MRLTGVRLRKHTRFGQTVAFRIPCECEVESMNENNAMAASWATLRTHLEAKTRALNAEVHSYPTPIARCDDQLPKLLEQRGRAVEQLKLVDAVGPMPAGNAA